VIERKNWLFAGSQKETAVSTGIYIWVEITQTNRLALMEYLKYILSNMLGCAFLESPEYPNDYLPWNP
jgi:hypothetical protein